MLRWLVVSIPWWWWGRSVWQHCQWRSSISSTPQHRCSDNHAPGIESYFHGSLYRTTRLLIIQGSHACLLESPGIFCKISRTWKVLENDFGPGKFWKFQLKLPVCAWVLIPTGLHDSFQDYCCACFEINFCCTCCWVQINTGLLLDQGLCVQWSSSIVLDS